MISLYRDGMGMAMGCIVRDQIRTDIVHKLIDVKFRISRFDVTRSEQISFIS